MTPEQGVVSVPAAMKKQSWVTTILTQLCLCFTLFLALNVGRIQRLIGGNRSDRMPMDVYFVSVAGGFRPLEEQTLLLKQMEKVAKIYKAEFVVNISEFGEDDPLTQNATQFFQSKRVHWYTTGALKEQGLNRYIKKIRIPHGKMLDFIAVNTAIFQDPLARSGNDHLEWLMKALQQSDSDWRIVAGFHPVVGCSESLGKRGAKDTVQFLRHIFLQHGVNVYLSGQACASHDRTGSDVQINDTHLFDKGPHMYSKDKLLLQKKEKVDGFLLHRISPLEMVTYLVTLKGEILQRIALQQAGREIM